MDLVGVSEIAELLGITRQRADQLLRQKGAPEPVAVLTQGRVFLREDIERWARETGRFK
ncbi:MAG: hypothetical protein ABSC31_01760 [Acidimicrobiales bacterium]|jgi:predicted DNA-binding transcriptional regulator AlpA